LKTVPERADPPFGGARVRRRWLLAIASCALVAVPFLIVDFVPSTDLPQHLGQLRLLADAWQGDGAELTVQWWTPYGLVYLLLAGPWLLLPPLLAGRVGVLGLVLLQVVTLHLLAARHRRPPTGALLASVFVLSALLYWGFLNFVFGSVVFFAWVELVRSDPHSNWRGRPRASLDAALFFVAAALLFLSHALWFAIGGLVLALVAAAQVGRRVRQGDERLWSAARPWLWRLLGVAPVLVAAFWWFAFLRGSNFATPAVWAAGPLARLDPRAIAGFALGGLRHPIELAVVLAAVLWVAAALIAARRRPAAGCDRLLALLALLFFLLYLFLPDKYANTIRFNSRWLPFAFMTLLLAVGAPPWRRFLRTAIVLIVLGSLVLVTTVYWHQYETEELAGLPEALAALPPEPRVIGLSYLEQSRFVTGHPFIQTFAWAQVVRGGKLNFSFGYFAPSLVVYENRDRVPWTWGLEWLPKAVRRSDFRQFDYALIGGDAEAHEQMARLPEIEPVTVEGLWRLYRVVPVVADD